MDFLIRDLVFKPDYWEGEDYERYQPGGYHPIIIGDIFSSGTSSYRMYTKLGHGSFSTVWLAENLNSTPNYVAVKVSTADDLSNNEADYLRSMSSPYIAPVLDSFSIDGPNGKHCVLVTEVMLPLLDFLETPRSLETCKTVIWRLVKAVEQLHGEGLIHGGNAGVTIPSQLQSLHVKEILLWTEYPVLIPILLESDIIPKRPESLPPYVTCRCDLKNLHKYLTEGNESESQAKLFDFGSVRKQGDDSIPLMCSKIARAPEINDAVKIDKVSNPVLQPASDIWALGTMIFEVMAGFPMFSAYELDYFETMIRLNDDEWWKQRSSYFRGRFANDADCDALVSLLKRILVLEPSERLSAAAIARDDWFSDISPIDADTLPRPLTDAGVM